MRQTTGFAPLLAIFLAAGFAAMATAKFAAAETPAFSSNNSGMLPPVRRIITFTDKNGSARVLADGAANNSREMNRSRITRLWETTEMPVPLSVTADLGETAGNAYREGFVGSSLYVADIPPGSNLSDIPMHAQDSLDYIAILEGSIDLVLPQGERRLNQGDVLIQAGNIHSWINRGETPCRMLVVVLTGTRD